GDRPAHLGPRPDEWLAVLSGDEIGHLVGPGRETLGNMVERGCPGVRGQRRGLGPDRVGGGDGLLDLVGCRVGRAPDDRPVVRVPDHHLVVARRRPTRNVELHEYEPRSTETIATGPCLLRIRWKD